MKLALFGSNGQFGQCFIDVFNEKLQGGSLRANLDTYSSAQVDITCVDSVRKVIEYSKPDVIINAAAYTAVDLAEDNPSRAFAVNEKGVMNLAKAANGVDALLVHISTDYVFDGKGVTPYKPDDLVNPLCVYGQSKLAGEKALESQCNKYLTLRTSWVFSEHGNNFVKTMLRLAKEHRELKVISDQYGTPTYAGDIAELILQLSLEHVENGLCSGVYHFSGDLATTWHGFSRAVFHFAKAAGVLKKSPILHAIDTSQYKYKALRPQFSVLNCQDLVDRGYQQPSWLHALEYIMPKLK